MGWFWGASSSSNDNPASSSSSTSPTTTSNSTSKEDAFKNLDPSLKDYLKKSTPSAPQPPPTAQAPRPTIPPPEAEIEYREPPHAQSQYGDRYADLWATYRPGGDKLIAYTPAEKIRDFVDDYSALKGEIRDAAIENCAFEQLARHECWMNGSWRNRMSMCSAESHELERCLEGQAAFLKALGYLTHANRDPEIEEMIQMHADKLYQQQKKQDKESEQMRKDLLANASKKRSDGIFSDEWKEKNKLENEKQAQREKVLGK